MRFLLRALAAIAVLLAVCIAISYRTIPSGNTSQTRFDTLIVLGNPAHPDGTPSPEARERVLEAVREYRAGVAHHLILTGGAAHNHFIEAHVMAQLAESRGVPAADVSEEPQAMNTIQNIFYSAEIMHQHGWRSAEVVSSPSHLPRASLIVTAFDREHPEMAFDWRTHAARWPAEYNLVDRISHYSAEASYCLKLRLLGFPKSRFLPGHPA
ncbi:MAG TPA: YdcF family protein [Granulicella sp.]